VELGGRGKSLLPRVLTKRFRVPLRKRLRRGNRKIFLREEARNSREGETATPRVSRQNASAFRYESGLRRGNRKIFLWEEARNSGGGWNCNFHVPTNRFRVPLRERLLAAWTAQPALESGNASTIPTIVTPRSFKRFSRFCGLKHSIKNQKSTFRKPQHVRVF
jgi:hypothetical protein